MGWTIAGARRYLSEFGLKPELSRISTEQGNIYLSELLKVDPNNMMNSNGYAYYIFSQKDDVKALLITTSTEDKKYQKESESIFTKLVKSIVKQTTSGKVGKNFTLDNNHTEQVGEHTLQIERDATNHQDSLRCVLSLTEDLSVARQWVDQIDYRAA